MIPGFNHNIKHKDVLYHVQTEDSGQRNPHVSTHLFIGGNIVASKKTEYRHLVGTPDLEAAVRKMMEEQHKQMLKDLRAGKFDKVEVAPSFQLDGPRPVNFATAPPAALPDPAPPPALAAAPLPSNVAAATLPPQAAPAAGMPGLPAPTARPAKKLKSTKTGGSFFGDNVISDKTLDEVVLTYLANNSLDEE